MVREDAGRNAQVRSAVIHDEDHGTFSVCRQVCWHDHGSTWRGRISAPFGVLACVPVAGKCAIMNCMVVFNVGRQCMLA